MFQLFYLWNVKLTFILNVVQSDFFDDDDDDDDDNNNNNNNNNNKNKNHF